MEAVAAGSCWEKFLHGNFQHLGEVEQRFVVHVGEASLDFRDAAAADVEAGDLQLCSFAASTDCDQPST